MKRTEKGITLIALIITIIVMLILVGVTVTSALNGGLFNIAKDAVSSTNNELAEEQKIASGMVYIGDKWYDSMDMYLKGIPVQTDDWSQDVIGEDELTVSKDGKYHIETCADLAKFARMVNGGNDFYSKTICLNANLNLQGNANKQWIPIGNSSHAFRGVFEGNDHYISGIYIDTQEEGEYGLFGNVSGMDMLSEGIVINLGIKNSTIKAVNGTAGGIVGVNVGSIWSCYNEAEIVAKVAGGITGTNFYNIIDCYNIGKISGKVYAGGLAGDTRYENFFFDSYNKGEIIALAEGAHLNGISANIHTEGCFNQGDFTISYENVTVNGISDLGATNCYNTGTINVTNSNYLNNSQKLITNGTINNSYCLSESPTEEYEKTEAYMKSQDFVDLLNGGYLNWKMDTDNINNGYPIWP